MTRVQVGIGVAVLGGMRRRSPIRLFVPLLLLGLTAPAAAGGAARGPAKAKRAPRLGTFVGTSHETGKGAQVTATVITSTRLHLEARPRNGRLYVKQRPADGKGTLWRQSFLITSDVVAADGARIIQYKRPAATTRTGKHNERTLGSWFAAEVSGRGGPPRLSDMEGTGVVEIRGDEVIWRNEGSGTMDPGIGSSYPLSWDETFSGKRAARGATASTRPSRQMKPETRMRTQWDRAIASFQRSGGILWPKPATGRIEGVDPNTGERIELSGNLTEGITIRRVTATGDVHETSVAPDGELTKTRDFTATGRVAQKHGVAPGTRLTEVTTKGSVVVKPGRPAPEQTPVLVIQ